MGITFACELGLKSFLYEKSSTRKVTGLLRSRVEKIEKFQTVWSNCGQTMVKLIIQEY